ncbi:MAG: hypothetical protein ABTQ73_12510 [Caldilineales bacterium]
MAREPSRSAAASELEIMRAEMRILKDRIVELRQRLDQLEDEMLALRALYAPADD